MKPVGLVRAGCALSALLLSLACSGGKQDKSVYQTPIGDPVNAFKADGDEQDASVVSSSALESGLDCSEPSSEQRLQGQVMGGTYRFVSRKVLAPDIPRSVKDEEVGYVTDFTGKFTKTYKLNEYSHRGQSALAGAPLAYTDTCTASGCDESQRRYTSGNPLYKFDVESRMSTMTSRDYYLPQTSCSLLPDSNPRKQTVQRGWINLDGTTYKAVKFTTKRSGSVSCEVGRISMPRAEGKTQVLGTGESVDTEIVLADKLPSSTISLPISNSSRGGCERTRVYVASYVTQGSKVINGSASDVANAKINGVIQSVAEYKAAKQKRADILRKLNDDITIARSEKNTVEYDATKASVDAREAKAKEQALSAEATRLEGIATRTGSTEQERKAYMDARQLATEAAARTKTLEQLASAKADLVPLANKRLAEAEAALRNFELNNR